MLQIEIPPDEWPTRERSYLARMLQNISNAIDGVNAVAIRDVVPVRPKEGKIYYLRKDLDDVAVEGYYVFINDEWKKLAYE